MFISGVKLTGESFHISGKGPGILFRVLLPGGSDSQGSVRSPEAAALTSKVLMLCGAVVR